MDDRQMRGAVEEPPEGPPGPAAAAAAGFAAAGRGEGEEQEEAPHAEKLALLSSLELTHERRLPRVIYKRRGK